MTDIATLERLRDSTKENIYELQKEKDRIEGHLKTAKDHLARLERDIELKKTEGAP